MKKYLASTLFICIILFNGLQISKNAGHDPYLPNGIILETNSSILGYNDSF